PEDLATSFKGWNVVSLGPERFTNSSPKLIIWSGNGRQIEDNPRLPRVLGLLDDSSCQVIFMPPSLNQDYCTTRFQASIRGRCVPFPGLLAINVRVGLFRVLYGVIDDKEVSAFSSDCTTHSGSLHTPRILCQLPSISRF